MIYGILRAQHLIGAKIKYGRIDCSMWHDIGLISKCAATPTLMFGGPKENGKWKDFNHIGSMNPINIKMLCAMKSDATKS